MCLNDVSAAFSARLPLRPSHGTRRAALTVGACMLVFAAACGSDDDAPSNPADAGGEAAGGSKAAAGAGGGSSAGTAGGASSAVETLVGTFNLRLVPEMTASADDNSVAAQTIFVGSVADGETPSVNTWVVDSEANGCKLYTPKSPFCDSCGATAVCVADDQCVERPIAQTVGTLKLAGVGASEISMTAIAGNYQPPAGTALPFPPCAEGDEVKLSADGGKFSPFVLTAKCIAPLEFPGPVAIVKGSPLKLTWKAPAQPTLARIQVHLDISHHGGARGKIECDLDDNGSIEMPATMVDKLVSLGVAGYPSVVLTRASRGGVASGEPKKVVLIVQEAVERAVDIAGLVSCADTTDCPSGQTCQSDLTCK
jgi:hypothetical protein